MRESPVDKSTGLLGVELGIWQGTRERSRLDLSEYIPIGPIRPIEVGKLFWNKS